MRPTVSRKRNRERVRHRIAKGLTLFIPGSIGFQEGSLVVLFVFFGHPPSAGVGLGLLRGAREIVCSALGFAVAWRETSSLRRS